MLEKWTSRSFRFDLPIDRAPVIASRLRGAAPRLAALGSLPASALVRRWGTAWSIQEHLGHLGDLDDLHLRRLDELARGAATLSAADMENKATWAAQHNERMFAAVLADFARRRAEFVARFAALDENGLARAALHPRLRQPMRAIDVAFFTAEHDDHHIAAAEALAAALASPLAPDQNPPRP